MEVLESIMFKNRKMKFSLKDLRLLKWRKSGNAMLVRLKIIPEIFSTYCMSSLVLLLPCFYLKYHKQLFL